MSVLSSLAAVQYYTALDPYNWKVDNRPLTDLDNNVQLVAGEVDKSLISKNLLARALGEAFASTTGPDCAVGVITNVGSWQLDYRRLVVNQSYNVDVASIQRIGVFAKFGAHDPGLLAAFTKPVTANSTRTWLVEARVVNTIAGETFVNSPDSDLSANNFIGSVEIQVLDYGSNQAGHLAKDDPALLYPSTTAGWIPLHRVCLYDTSVSIQMNLHVTDMNFYHLGTVDSRQLATTNTPADGKVLFAEPGVGGTYNTYGMHWDYPLPTPPNSGKVLTSTSAIPGGYSWQDPVASPSAPSAVSAAFDNPGVILIANANGVSSRVKVSPFKSGKVVIQGTEYTLDPAGYNIDTNALTINRMHAVYLVPGAPYAGVVYEVVPDLTSQSGYFPGYNPAVGQTVRISNLGVWSNDHLFVGHIYVNVWVSTSAYYNMAQVYVRSYYNDYGTASSVFNNNADPAQTVWDSVGFTVSQKNGRINNEARLLTSSLTGEPYATNSWGYGSTTGDYPSTTATLYASHIPPSTDLVLGTIMWPFETVEVTGSFDAYISLTSGSGTLPLALRAWSPLGLISHPPGGVGVPVTSSSIYATCMAMQWITNTDASYTSYSRNITTVSSQWRTDNVPGNTSAYRAQFQIFDMIWHSGITCYGRADGCTRFYLKNEINRVPPFWLGGY